MESKAEAVQVELEVIMVGRGSVGSGSGGDLCELEAKAFKIL